MKEFERRRSAKRNALAKSLRNRLKKEADDGTVTRAFMDSIYANLSCSYCGRPIPREDRTADHVVLISSGCGKHSACNIVMACFKCNSAKGDMTGEEYRSLPR